MLLTGTHCRLISHLSMRNYLHWLFWIAVASAIILQRSINAKNFPKPQGCSSDFFNTSIAPRNMTPRNVHMAFIASATNNGRDRLIAGAFFIALADLHKKAQDNGIPVNFTWSFHDSWNLENRAMKLMADLYCEGNVSAFIGPKAYCQSAGLMATAYNIPYMTFGCQDNTNDTVIHRMINTDPSIIYVSKVIKAVLTYYKWTSFWLVTGLEEKWKNTALKLKDDVHGNITINGETVAYDKFIPNHLRPDTNPFVKITPESKDKTRVYVFLGNYDSLILFARQIHAESLANNNAYVVVAVDDSDESSRQQFYLTLYEIKKPEQSSPAEIQQKVEAFRNVLVIAARNQNSDLTSFENNVYYRSLESPINYPTPPPPSPAMPGAVYHLYDATMIFGLSVMSLMVDVDADPTNSSQVIKYIKGRRHCSKQGKMILIHANGETEDSYAVKGHTNFNGKIHPNLEVVGSIDIVHGIHTYIEQTPLWPKGEVPKSNPECGFEGCDESLLLIIIPVSITGLIICIAAFCLLKKYVYERKLDKLLWKIDMDKIQFTNVNDLQEAATPKTKKKESISENHMSTFLLSDTSDSYGLSVSDQNCSMPDQPCVGYYKNGIVFVKQMTQKHLELTRNLKREFLLRKEMTHENIVRFIGAAIDPDILEDQALPQEEMFKTSLVQDLINGMAFIHESDFRYHGNLKSTNCLVDRRWTLKITDFGFGTMVDHERSIHKRLWTAPEFLQRRFTSSSSYSSQNHSSFSQTLRMSRIISSFHHHNKKNNNSGYIQSQQKGDVYSFSIILYELYGQAGPWGKTNLTCRDIIDKLMSSSFSEPFRPDTTPLKCDPSIITLMQSCWSPEAESRPDFKYIIKQRFKPKQQGTLMELYADNLETLVAKRTEQLKEEKKMTENLLLRMLPKSVANKLMRRQQVNPEQFECVTIYFSDIVGFTELSAESTPMEVVDLLNDLYTLFDSVIHKFQVYKVETIGDAYMVVSGLPNSIGDSHAGEIASMSLLFLQKLKEKRFTIRGQTDNMLKIRIGIHSGSCCAGVVGLKMPRYCLFGDTVNTANRMESTGEALKIHCSAECKAILDKLGGYQLEKRGHIEVKGKGQLFTYFLIGEDKQIREKRLLSMESNDRCVSTSNLDYLGTPLNRRSAPPLMPISPNQNSCRSSTISLPQSRTSFRVTKNSIVPMGLNRSMDSTMSAPVVHDDSIDDVNFISDSRSSTLPRPIIRQNSLGGKSMSPIAEDPWTPNGNVLREKCFHYNANEMGSSDAESECDTLLRQMPRNSLKRNSNHHQNTAEHSPVISLTNSSSHPETVL